MRIEKTMFRKKIVIRKFLMKHVIQELHEIFKNYRLSINEVLIVCMYFISIILSVYPEEQRKKMLKHITLTLENCLNEVKK